MIPGLDYVKLIGGALVVIAIAAAIFTAKHWRDQRDALQLWQNQVTTAAGVRASDVVQQIHNLQTALKDVELKVAQEQAKDLADAKAKENQDTQTGQETSSDYEAQIAAVRADYDNRLRAAVAQSANDNSRSGAKGMSSTPTTPGGSCQAACQNQLPPADALTATEQAIQLQHILDWGKKVGIVR